MSAMAKEVVENPGATPFSREHDMLLTAGERVSMSLLTLALLKRNLPAMSLTGSQCGIITSDKHGDANIHDLRPTRLSENLACGKISVVAGFQGVSEAREITTLGRGGSDFTAVALAEHFGASRTVLYKDVPGFYAQAPHLAVSDEHRVVPALSWREAFYLSLFGANVIHWKAALRAWKTSTPYEIRSSFQDLPGSRIANSGDQQHMLMSSLEAKDLSEEQFSLMQEYFSLSWEDKQAHQAVAIVKTKKSFSTNGDIPIKHTTVGDWICLLFPYADQQKVGEELANIL